MEMPIDVRKIESARLVGDCRSATMKASAIPSARSEVMICELVSISADSAQKEAEIEPAIDHCWILALRRFPIPKIAKVPSVESKSKDRRCSQAPVVTALDDVPANAAETPASAARYNSVRTQ